MSAITTHVLDTSAGHPAADVPVALHRERRVDTGWELLGVGATDANGRVKDLLPAETPLETCLYRLSFDTGAYFLARGIDPFIPEASVVIAAMAGEHYHVPLLLTPYGYTTYRGS